MTKEPFFSIIMPTFNRGPLLVDAVKSVLKQDFKDFELIIIDDGSTDNSQTLIKKLADARINYLWKKNEERNIARNYGIEKAKGKYIGFLDSDDIIYNNHLTHAFSFIKSKNQPEVIHLNFEVVNKATSNSRLTEKHIENLNHELINDNILSSNSIFVKRDIIKQFQFLHSTNALIGEDHYLWLRLASRFKFHLSLEVTSAVREHDSRSLNNIDVDKLILGTNEIIVGLHRDQEFLNFYGWKARRFFAYNYVFLALHLALSGRKKESIKNLVNALIKFPLCLFTRRYFAVIKTLLLT